MTITEFGLGDHVRFIGTDTIQTIRQYDAETLEYQIQRGDDAASLVWVPEIYLELVNRQPRIIDASSGAICRRTL